jgi:RNA polymerase sigma-70 factor (ECF subfamily)
VSLGCLAGNDVNPDLELSHRTTVPKRNLDSRWLSALALVEFLTHLLNTGAKLSFREPNDLSRRLAGVRGGRAVLARMSDPMQELVLIQPGRTAEKEFANEAAQTALRREFEERLRECGPLAYRVARGVLRNSADAEDVAQEALLRAYRRFERLRDRGRFRAWLVRIAFRLAIDRTRSSKRREVRETLWSQAAPRASTEDIAATSEFQAHLERAMDELPEKQRLVLLLAAMEGHTLDEVAAMLGLPVGTVKSRLFFARKQLVEKLRCHVKTIEKR